MLSTDARERSGGRTVAGARRRPQRHHVASNKARASGYTALFADLFERAGMTLRHEANILAHPDHGRGGYAGAHGAKYNRWVLGRLERAVEGLAGDAYRRALCLELSCIKQDLLREPRLLKGEGLR